MLDIFRILDKVIHMKISQIFKSNFKHLQHQKIINTKDVNPTNANSDEMYVYALNLKENNKASFEDTVLKVAMSEAKSRVENEYRGTFSKDAKLDSKALISDIIAQSSSNWDYENKAKWQNFLELLG